MHARTEVPETTIEQQFTFNKHSNSPGCGAAAILLSISWLSTSTLLNWQLQALQVPPWAEAIDAKENSK